MLSEKEYYPAVKHYIGKKFNCINTGIGKGYLALGLADVIGAYDISNEVYSDIEVIMIQPW